MLNIQVRVWFMQREMNQISVFRCAITSLRLSEVGTGFPMVTSSLASSKKFLKRHKFGVKPVFGSLKQWRSRKLERRSRTWFRNRCRLSASCYLLTFLRNMLKMGNSLKSLSTWAIAKLPKNHLKDLPHRPHRTFFRMFGWVEMWFFKEILLKTLQSTAILNLQNQPQNDR